MNTTDTTKTKEINPQPHHWQLLPGAQFADSYRAALPQQLAQLDADAITTRMMACSPGWVRMLLSLRNRLVAPFGLKGTRLLVGAGQPDGGSPGFPVIEQSPSQLIMGMDDSHLDFRLCVEKSTAQNDGQWLTVTTVVCTKRLLGRAYLTTIMPFHRCIVRTLLERVVR